MSEWTKDRIERLRGLANKWLPIEGDHPIGEEIMARGLLNALDEIERLRARVHDLEDAQPLPDYD